MLKDKKTEDEEKDVVITTPGAETAQPVGAAQGVTATTPGSDNTENGGTVNDGTTNVGDDQQQFVVNESDLESTKAPDVPDMNKVVRSQSPIEFAAREKSKFEDRTIEQSKDKDVQRAVADYTLDEINKEHDLENNPWLAQHSDEIDIKQLMKDNPNKTPGQLMRQWARYQNAIGNRVDEMDLLNFTKGGRLDPGKTRKENIMDKVRPAVMDALNHIGNIVYSHLNAKKYGGYGDKNAIKIHNFGDQMEQKYDALKKTNLQQYVNALKKTDAIQQEKEKRAYNRKMEQEKRAYELDKQIKLEKVKAEYKAAALKNDPVAMAKAKEEMDKIKFAQEEREKKREKWKYEEEKRNTDKEKADLDIKLKKKNLAKPASDTGKKPAEKKTETKTTTKPKGKSKRV